MKIMLIDDDALSLEVLSSWLDQEGIAHRTFLDPYQALEAFDQDGDFTTLITDMKMRGMTGLEVVRQLHHRQPDLPVILVTAFPEEELRLHEEGVWVSGIYRKPIDIEALTEQLRKLDAESEDTKREGNTR
jgi:CheY-like chemotaxis protein